MDSNSEPRRPGPKADRVKIEVPFEEAVDRMLRAPPMPKGEKKPTRERRRGGNGTLGSAT